MSALELMPIVTPQISLSLVAQIGLVVLSVVAIGAVSAHRRGAWTLLPRGRAVTRRVFEWALSLLLTVALYSAVMLSLLFGLTIRLAVLVCPRGEQLLLAWRLWARHDYRWRTAWRAAQPPEEL